MSSCVLSRSESGGSYPDAVLHDRDIGYLSCLIVSMAVSDMMNWRANYTHRGPTARIYHGPIFNIMMMSTVASRGRCY